jgi:DNA polymerase III subunit gamma/tau
VSQAGDGSLRDALSLLDQLLAFGNGQALEADTRAMLGTVARDHVIRVADALANGDAAGLLNYANSLDELAPDYAQLLEQLAALFERIALRQLVTAYEGDELHPVELLAEYAGRITPEDLQLYYQTAITGRRDLVLAPDARTGFRMTLIRMLAFRPAGALTPSPTPQPRTAASVGTTGAASAAPGFSTPAAVGVPRVVSAASVSLPPASALPRAPDVDASLDWTAILAALDLGGGARQLANNCALLGREGATLRLALDPRSSAMHTPAFKDKLAQALTRHFGTPMRLEIEVRATAPETPARAVERNEAEQRSQAQALFEADPNVGAFKQRFGASVLPDSVRPVKPGE